VLVTDQDAVVALPWPALCPGQIIADAWRDLLVAVP